jgi:hypothetical protein
MTDKPKRTITEALNKAKTGAEFGGVLTGFMRAYDQQRFNTEDEDEGDE